MTRGVRKAKKPMLKRLQDKFLVGDGCWLWIGYRDPNGYGRITDGDRKVHQAHRVLYELIVGPIPEGLVLDHLCRNTGCVNPGHLEPVTDVENIQRGFNHYLTKTHCPSGHPYRGTNLGRMNASGSRRCLTCHRENERKRRDRRKAGL